MKRAIDCRIQWPSLTLPEDDLDLSPLNHLVGDYKSTLQTCKKFLQENSSFERNAAGVIKRIRWNVQLADDVAELRSRIIFHNVRLSAILQPLNLTLFTRLEEDLKGLRQDIRTGFIEIRARLDRIEAAQLGHILQETAQARQSLDEALPQVPPYLRASFVFSAQSQAVGVNDQIRLSSLVGHLENGTIKLRVGRGEAPDPVQYVNLWKSVWIMHQLKASPTYDAFIASELTACLIKEHQKMLLAEVRRFAPESNDLLEPNQQDVENLPSSEFLVWLFEPSKPRQRLLDPNPDEFRVFESPLVDPSDREIHHVVLYASRDQRNILRVVTTSTSKYGNAPEMHQEIAVDVTEAKLYPIYAQPDATVFNIQLKTSPHNRSDKFFLFRTLPELYAFQQCFTSFHVKLDLPDLVKVTIKQGGLLSSMSRAQVLANYGRAQIWTHELSGKKARLSSGNPQLSPPSQKPRHASSSDQSGTLHASHTTSSQSASQTLVDWTSIHAPSVVWREDHTELPFPEPPMLVLLMGEVRREMDTTIIDVFRLLSMPLDGSVVVDPGKCDCRNHDDACKKVILVNCRSGNLKATLFDYGADVTGMNLAVLRLPLRHQDSKQKQFVKKLNDIGRMAIEFTNVKDKKDFRERLSSVTDNYIALWNEYQRSKNEVRHADHVDRRRES